MKIKKVHEMFIDTYDYNRIINILKKQYDWGFGVMNFFEDFESDENYFFQPLTDEDYAKQMNIYLSDLEMGNMRGKFQNKHSLRLGRWKMGTQVGRPESIYNKLI